MTKLVSFKDFRSNPKIPEWKIKLLPKSENKEKKN